MKNNKNNIPITRSMLFLLLTVHLSVCLSAESDPIKQLLDAGQAQEAYSAALQRLDKEEGDPNFDFLYGLAAIETGRADIAIFALERVLFSQPGNLRVRLELGRAYFLLGDLATARKQFETVLSKNPPKNVKTRINIYLDSIKKKENALKTKYSANIEVTHGYDSNINSATSNSTVRLPTVGTVLLNASSQEDSEVFRKIKLKAEVQHALSKKKGLFASFDINHLNNFGSDSLDSLETGIKGGYAFLKNSDRYELSLQYQHMVLDGRKYRTLPAINGQWGRKISALNSVISFAQYAQIRYPDSRLRDVDLSMLGGIWYRNIPDSKMLLTVSAYVADERPKYFAGSNNGREYYGLRAGLQWSRNSKNSVYGVLGLQEVEHDSNAPVFAVIRDDRNMQFLLGSAWKLDRDWTLKLELDVADNNSNIPLYDYKRNQLYFTLRYKIR